MVERITQLPRRHFLFWDKTHRATFLRSPRLDLDAIRCAAEAAPADVHTAIAQGVSTDSRSVLEARLEASRAAAIPPSVPPSVPIVIPADDSPFPRIG